MYRLLILPFIVFCVIHFIVSLQFLNLRSFKRVLFITVAQDLFYTLFKKGIILIPNQT